MNMFVPETAFSAVLYAAAFCAVYLSVFCSIHCAVIEHRRVSIRKIEATMPKNYNTTYGCYTYY